MTKDAINEARTLLAQELQRVQNALKTDKTRRRGALMRRFHALRQMMDTGYGYRSQAGQDLVVDQILKGKRGGVFLDIGAYDGLTGSNSFFFEVYRGWTGLMVEPVAAQAEKAREVRRAPLAQCAVARTNGEAEFLEITEGYTQMSGLMDSYDPAMLQNVRSDTRHKEAVTKVPTRTLASLIDQLGAVPDYVSLDIEGGELDVLSDFAFRDYPVALWSVENNTGTSEIRKVMEAAGYSLVEFCGPDEIYHLRQN